MESFESRATGEEFMRSAVEAAVLIPYDGIAQLFNKIEPGLLPLSGAGTREPAEIGSPCWAAQQAGHALGTAAQIIALHKVCSGARLGGAPASHLERLSGAMSIGRAAKVGFVMGSVLQPVDETAGNFWAQRGVNGASTSLSLGVYAGMSSRLNAQTRHLEGVTIPGLPIRLLSQLRNEAVSGAVAGVAAAESHSLMSGRGYAPGSELFNSGLSFALTGPLLGAYGRLSSQQAAQSRSFLKTPELESPAIRSTMLTSLTRTHPGLTPVDLSARVAELPKTPLGLPDKNLDVGAWKGNERLALYEHLESNAQGSFSGEAATRSLVSKFAHHNIDALGLKLGESLASGDPARVAVARSNLQMALGRSLTAFNAENGLPPLAVSLEGALPPKVNGVYKPGSGTLILNEKIMRNGLTSEAVEFISHEGTHFDQDVLRVRKAKSVADETGTPVESHYPGSHLSRSFLDAVAASPRSGPLLPSEQLRLAALDQSVVEYGQGPGAQQIMQIDKVLRTPGMVTGKPGLMEDLAGQRNHAVDRYVGARFESEAWAAGLLAHIKARALGVRPPANDPTIFSQPEG